MSKVRSAGLMEFGAIATLAVLAWLATIMVRIPIPATGGYFNIGDVFVLFAALWLGPKAGFLVGLFGPTAGDVLGFPQFILATAVTKSLEGFIAGSIGRRSQSPRVKLLAAIAGGATMVAGYFLFEALVYPALGQVVPFFAITTLGAAVVELGPNTVQAIISSLVAFALWKTFVRESRQEPQPVEETVGATTDK